MDLIRIGIPSDPLLAAVAEGVLDELRSVISAVERVDLPPVPPTARQAGWDAACRDALALGMVDVCLRRLESLPVPVGAGWCIAALSERTPPGFSLLVDREAADPQAPFHLPAKSGVYAEHPTVAAQLTHLHPTIRVSGTGPVDRPLPALATPGVHALLLDNRHLTGPAEIPESFIQIRFHPREIVPLPGQGTLAWLCRPQDLPVRSLLARIHRPAVARVTNIERRTVQLLGTPPDTAPCVFCTQDAEGHYHAHAAHRPGDARPVVLARRSQSTSAGLSEALAGQLAPSAAG